MGNKKPLEEPVMNCEEIDNQQVIIGTWGQGLLIPDNANLKVKATTNFYGSLSTTQAVADLQFRRNEPSGGVGLSGIAVGIIRVFNDDFRITNQPPNGVLNLVASDATGQINFMTAGFDRMRISLGGLVGIGTNNPITTTFIFYLTRFATRRHHNHNGIQSAVTWK